MDILKISHILIPTDFSPASINAIDTAIALAKRQNAAITLLHVVNEGLLSYGHFDTIPITTPVLQTMRDDSGDMLDQLVAKFVEQHGIEIKGETVSGLVSSAICKAAEKFGADLIVMGTHGATGFREFFIGTNAYAVVKHAPCPVLTVPPHQQWNVFSKILFPVRNNTNALGKYSFLRKIIRHNKAVLHFLGLPDADRPDDSDWLEKNIQPLTRELLEDEVTSVTQILNSSDRAAADVLEIADSQDIDLIAITANIDRDIRDFFIGPYSQQIVNHAKVPVLSIRPTPLPADTIKVVQNMRQDYGSFVPNLALKYPRLALEK